MSRGDDAVHPYEVVAHYYGGGAEDRRVPGITIRERFAMAAMWSPRNPCNSLNHEEAAEWALEDAAALLAELAKPVKP